MQAAENSVVVQPRRRRIGQWFRQRLAGMLTLDTRRPRAAIAGLWLFTSLAAGVCALGLPTGFGTTFDVATGVALNTIAMPLAAWIIAALLALVGLRVPRFAAGSALYSGALLFFILLFADFAWLGSVIYALAFTLIAAAAGLLADTAIRSRRNAAIVGGSAIILWIGMWAAGALDRTAAGDDADRGEVQALATVMEDPSGLGEYLVDAFTYGSGADKRRSEFGQDADELSRNADASAYIEGGDWTWLRTKFWGFDESSLPLNGRVWMPQGEGPFPIVLMVHGNHLMEQFSDAGYGYLGELLASRGIIAISVDENFLNFSAWSGIPDQDMKLRAWMLLKHIGQLQQFAADPSSRLHGKIDFRQIALVGHSRGGQAVAMAADREQWFSSDDTELPSPSSYRIEGVVAIAPTDTFVDGRQANLRDVSYLTLQGARDADLVNFNGDRQYARVDIADGADAFKASLYVAGANHSQFNTAWGEFDNSFPGRLFIRPAGKLEPGAQRQIAKTYVSAFMETVFHQEEQYRSLFRDYRTGLRILPSTAYYNQYQDGRFQPLAEYEGDDRANPGPRATAEAIGLTDWRHIEAQNRQLQNTGDRGLLLKWDEQGVYSVRAASFGQTLDAESKLVFSIARVEDSASNGTITVQVKDRSGVAVTLPLSRFADVLPAPKTDFTWLPGGESAISDGKFAGEWEAVYQTVELPLGAFEDEDPDFTPSEWEELAFGFAGGPGSVLIDDLGLDP
ncbi:alpha/beta hydrolase [Cohnella panacarvi]|uniref:alpha/beta hydrolase n=1 Tax=Cohnella panacarvi TaxID=400776 RepID=UPI0004799852|nr:alpha/beta hydrolase [Cohnella panacarvi]